MRMKGQTPPPPEEKWVNDDGREVVYDGASHEIVTDIRYKGTYNYVNPPKNWPPKNFEDCWRTIGHGVADVLPYGIWKN